MTLRPVVMPMCRAYFNYPEVAWSIGVDIIAGRYAEGTRLARRRRIDLHVSRQP
jgi:hypothetical protein